MLKLRFRQRPRLPRLARRFHAGLQARGAHFPVVALLRRRAFAGAFGRASVLHGGKYMYGSTSHSADSAPPPG
eukprot:3638025-Prymnesium_polylepis.2